jgi:glucose-1-phosphate thymidylyltransferase
LAQAFVIEEFIGKTVLVLGDNIFFGSNMDELLRSNKNLKGSCFAYHVSDPNDMVWLNLIKTLMHFR